MNEKNPYENDESVEIPDFKSIKDDDIDYSKLQLDDNEEYEEYEDDEPKYRSVKQSVIIITTILLVVLLILSIFSLILGINKNKAYNNLQAEYEEYKTKAIANETALNAKIVELETTLAAEEKEEEVVEASDSYTIVVDSLYVRSDASKDGDNYANYASLSSEVKAKCAQDGTKTIVYKGQSFTVSETKKNGDATWGKIDDNAWICLNDGSNNYCEKQ